MHGRIAYSSADTASSYPLYRGRMHLRLRLNVMDASSPPEVVVPWKDVNQQRLMLPIPDSWQWAFRSNENGFAKRTRWASVQRSTQTQTATLASSLFSMRRKSVDRKMSTHHVLDLRAKR